MKAVDSDGDGVAYPKTAKSLKKNGWPPGNLSFFFVIEEIKNTTQGVSSLR